jgi:hypothetical protein
MSRLYREPEGFRNLQPREFLEKVIKIIPSEVIAGYMFLISTLPVITVDPLRNILKWIIFSVLIASIPLYYRSLAKGQPFIRHAVISIVAFAVWSYSISGPTMMGDEYYDPIVASLSLMSFTILSPYVRLDP